MNQNQYKIQQEILDHWTDQSIRLCSAKFPPLIYPDLESRDILFIGLNPSIAESEEKKYSEIEPSVDALAADQLEQWRKHRHFQPYHDLEEYLKERKYPITWAAIDLFLDRETKSKVLLNAIRAGKNLTSEAKVQIEYAKKFVEIAAPKMIVVASAAASHILRDELRGCSCNPLPCLSPKLEEDGTYRTIVNNQKNIPVFFSAMLVNGALDAFSRERLFLHIAKTLCPKKSLPK